MLGPYLSDVSVNTGLHCCCVACCCRHFRPAPYQVLQEMSMRQKRGEPVDAEAALQPPTAKPGRSRMDLANRLRQRKDRQRQGRSLYSGFVPPYNTQSRVFDANELRRAATQVRGETWGAQTLGQCNGW